MNRHTLSLSAAWVALASTAAVARAATPTYEFASVAFAGGRVTWTDKAGERADPAAGPAKVFADLSGEAERLAGSPQALVLVLDGLSKKGWEVVAVSNPADRQVFLVKREVTAATTGGTAGATTTGTTTAGDEKRVPLTFAGGHETDGRDRGRPVALVAAGLGVPDEVFRDAFTHVRPAGPGQEPDPDQVRKNKAALLAKLGPYGVTNDRLDAVSNYYRYAGTKGETWKQRPAVGYAVVRDGAVVSVTITDAGAGYTTPPTVTVAGAAAATLTPTLAFGTDLATNGSVKGVAVGDPPRVP